MTPPNEATARLLEALHFIAAGKNSAGVPHAGPECTIAARKVLPDLAALLGQRAGNVPDDVIYAWIAANVEDPDIMNSGTVKDLCDAWRAGMAYAGLSTASSPIGNGASSRAEDEAETLDFGRAYFERGFIAAAVWAMTKKPDVSIGDAVIDHAWEHRDEGVSGDDLLPTALRAPAASSADAGRLAGWLVYEPSCHRPEFQAYDITDADRRAGVTSKPVYFAAAHRAQEPQS